MCEGHVGAISSTEICLYELRAKWISSGSVSDKNGRLAASLLPQTLAPFPFSSQKR